MPVTTTHPYGRSLRGMLIGALVLIVLEGGLVELVVAFLAGRVWAWAAFALHLLALLWFGWMLLVLRTRPHLVQPGLLRLRDMASAEVAVPIPAIASATAKVTTNIGRSGKKIKGDALLLAHGNATVTLTLDRPVEVKGRPVTSIALTVDDPAVFLAALAAQGVAGANGSSSTTDPAWVTTSRPFPTR